MLNSPVRKLLQASMLWLMAALTQTAGAQNGAVQVQWLGQSAMKITTPGGKVIVDIPRMASHSGSHHFGEEIGKNLPFYNGADPEKIEEMLKGAGLSKISTIMLETSGDEEKKTLLIYGEKI